MDWLLSFKFKLLPFEILVNIILALGLILVLFLTFKTLLISLEKYEAILCEFPDKIFVSALPSSII